MDKWTIFFYKGGMPVTHCGYIEERNGVFYCYDNNSKIKYVVPVRNVEYIRNDGN